MATDKTGYDRKKIASAAREEEQSRKGREIGHIPPVVDLERRAACSRDLRLYGETYHPELLYLATSPDQDEMIKAIQNATLNGNLQAMAMPRGSGKTTWCEFAAEWAALNGHHGFAVLIGATEPHAENMLATIKNSLEANDLLFEDFPEACYPIRCLEGIVNRCKGQLLDGERTSMEWVSKQAVLPTVRLPGSWNGPRRPDGFALSSTAVIKVAGITGSIRGMKYKGRRPTLVLPDDPQTRESAKSFEQSADRVKTLQGDVLGLAGPRRKICGLMPCTVIHPGDMADQILDHKRHPEWRGLRKKMVYSFPSAVTLWDKYADILSDSQVIGGDGSEATEFYRENQTAMDEGAVVSWPERFNEDELSAVQNAMNLKIRDEEAFFAEYQNEPIDEKTEHVKPLTVDQIASKFNRVSRGVVPLGASVLTAMIDVQKDYLLWAVGAFDPQGFTGSVIDYGLWPETKRSYFRLSDDLPTLLQMYPGGSRDAAWFQGITDLIEQLTSRDWLDESGASHRIEGGLVDASYGESTDSVYHACRSTPHRQWLPAHGRGVKAGQKSVTQTLDKPGDKKGLHWRITTGGQRGQKHLLYGTNEWKTFTAERLRTPIGDKGSISLFGDRPSLHRMLAEQCVSEYATEKTVGGMTSLEWALLPGRENHYWDIVVGLVMRASTAGCSLLGLGGKKTGEKKKKFTFAEKMAQRGARA